MKTKSKSRVFGLRETGRYILCLRVAHVHGVHVEKTIEAFLIPWLRRLDYHTWHRPMFVPGITCHFFLSQVFAHKVSRSDVPKGQTNLSPMDKRQCHSRGFSSSGISILLLLEDRLALTRPWRIVRSIGFLL